MDSKQGFLVLADISGFTALLTATELEHGPAIIADLLEEVIRRISPPLEIQEIEGDAVFALAPEGTVVPPAKILEVLRGGFVGFQERRQAIIDSEDACPCNACTHVDRLRLKAIGHYGSFLPQMVAGRPQVAGSDVILVHRLLKNNVPRKDDNYALFTRRALEQMSVDPASAGLQPHIENYEHFGDIECFFGRAEV
jgi:hypothetical protein